MELLKATEKEQARQVRDRALAADFRTLRKVYPEASVERIVRTIAAGGKYGLSEPGIKRVLYATGTITPNRKRA